MAFSEYPTPDFQVLFETAPSLCLVLAPDLRIVAVSDAYLQATMTKRSEILGRNVFDVFPDNPDDPTATGVQNLNNSLQSVLKNKLPHTMAIQKYDIRRPESEGGGFEVRYWNPINSPVLNASREVICIINRVEDITEFVLLKQQDSERRRINEELQLRTSQMEAEIFLRAQKLQIVNNQLQKLTQAALAINAAFSIEDVLDVITRQAYQIIGAHQSVTSMTTDQNWSQSITSVYLSDKYATWRQYDEPTNGSGIYALVCQMNRPIRMTQAELESHQSWRGFGDEASKHPPMRGWLAAPLIGRDGGNIGLIQLSDKYEGEFTLEDEAILMQLAQIASIAIENVRLYTASQQARADAEAANRIKDEFLAVLSHELRTPLNPILGWSKLLQSKKLDEAKTALALTTIERNAKLQAELIEDLLDVSRILQGKLSLNTTQVNLISIIEAAIETVRLAAEAKSIKIETNFNIEAATISGDSSRLQQVVWNLLSNAVKFSQVGGDIKVQLERVDDQAQITVSDNGKGIDADFLPHVFEYFRQADSTTTRKFGGLGLGLAIVRHLVEMHGGIVTAESPGQDFGSTFIVKLPLVPIEKVVQNHHKPSKPALNLNGAKILVVDDETDTKEVIAFILQQAAADVITAASAKEALTALAQFEPDVLISDIGMPDMNGYMLIKQVRQLAPHLSQIKALALTAYAGEINYQLALQAGFQAHLSKPVEPEKLIETVINLLN
ncbi:two-component hybrid sensor and regulator [Rivularia sp. IAM M-261]|nr:two-component hybrid sensor and regulator [Calothrix sp. PCC 7716]GJD18445.1 two-component hybrid sensor and regulator [Rivularia sp. IAM M-261]